MAPPALSFVDISEVDAHTVDDGMKAKSDVSSRSTFRRKERACAVTLLLLALFGAGTYAAWRAKIVPAGVPMPGPVPVERAFQAFTAKYSKVYETPVEAELRFNIFKANYAIIDAENSKGRSYTLTVNEFADQTAAEFGSSHYGFNSPAPAPVQLWQGLAHLGTDRHNSTSAAGLPESVDWAQKGAVTTPKNQGGCGSCWAFSTTGALEGAWQIATGKLVSLSEQQLIDCNKQNNACGGGAMDPAFTYLKDHAVCTEDSYKYESKSGTCRQTTCKAGIPQSAVKGYKDVANDEKSLMAAVAKGPVSVGIEADQQSFQLYGGGVLAKKCGDKLDHGVLVVGYGLMGNVPYWKVKNSWGPAWGEKGYIRIERGLKGAGECGINSMPSYPVVDGKKSFAAQESGESESSSIVV